MGTCALTETLNAPRLGAVHRETCTNRSDVRLQVGGLLSPRGQLFMVTVADNDPDEILRHFQESGLAGGEHVVCDTVLQALCSMQGTGVQQSPPTCW